MKKIQLSDFINFSRFLRSAHTSFPTPPLAAFLRRTYCTHSAPWGNNGKANNNKFPREKRRKFLNEKTF